MKIYVLTSHTSNNTEIVSRMVDFLAQRGHQILGFETKTVTATYLFEHQIELLKTCDWFILEAGEAGYGEGFLSGLATNKFQKKSLIVYNSAQKKSIPEFLLGCTYPNCHIKSYKTWVDLQNILTLLKF